MNKKVVRLECGHLAYVSYFCDVGYVTACSECPPPENAPGHNRKIVEVLRVTTDQRLLQLCEKVTELERIVASREDGGDCSECLELMSAKDAAEHYKRQWEGANAMMKRRSEAFAATIYKLIELIVKELHPATHGTLPLEISPFLVTGESLSDEALYERIEKAVRDWVYPPKKQAVDITPF